VRAQPTNAGMPGELWSWIRDSGTASWPEPVQATGALDWRMFDRSCFGSVEVGAGLSLSSKAG
jgi:hypothetical protein